MQIGLWYLFSRLKENNIMYHIGRPNFPFLHFFFTFENIYNCIINGF